MCSWRLLGNASTGKLSHRSWGLSYKPVNRLTGCVPASLILGRELLDAIDRILVDCSEARAVSSAPTKYFAKLCTRLTEALHKAHLYLSSARSQQKVPYDRLHHDARCEVGDRVLRSNPALSNASMLLRWQRSGWGPTECEKQFPHTCTGWWT